MTLPAERRKGSSTHAALTSTRRPMSAKVLVIDDEKDILSLLRYHLEKAGFQCMEGMDGAVAVPPTHAATPFTIITERVIEPSATK